MRNWPRGKQQNSRHVAPPPRRRRLPAKVVPVAAKGRPEVETTRGSPEPLQALPNRAQSKCPESSSVQSPEAPKAPFTGVGGRRRRPSGEDSESSRALTHARSESSTARANLAGGMTRRVKE